MGVHRRWLITDLGASGGLTIGHEALSGRARAGCRASARAASGSRGYQAAQGWAAAAALAAAAVACWPCTPSQHELENQGNRLDDKGNDRDHDGDVQPIYLHQVAGVVLVVGHGQASDHVTDAFVVG